MNDRAPSARIIIPLAEVRSKMKARNQPKGRQIEPQARADVVAIAFLPRTSQHLLKR
jgi:hypothetical protein